MRGAFHWSNVSAHMSVVAARRTIHIGLAVEHQLSEQTSRDITHLSRRSLARSVYHQQRLRASGGSRNIKLRGAALPRPCGPLVYSSLTRLPSPPQATTPIAAVGNSLKWPYSGWSIGWVLISLPKAVSP